MRDIQKLIDETLPFVEGLLHKYGEFYPLAATVSSNGKVQQMGTYDGNEHPNSIDVINNLKRSLTDGARKGAYRATAIFYDARVINPHTNIKTDAIAVYAESEDDINAYIFYYPYILTLDKQVNLSQSFGTKAKREIFGR